MKILFLPAYFTPESLAGSYYLFENIYEAFTEADIRMEVYTPSPTRGISDEIRKRYKKIRKEEFYNGKIIVHRFSMFREGNIIFMRAVRYILCSLVQLIKGLFAKEIDVIVVDSTPPIQGAMAAILKKLKKIPFVYFLQDIFPDSLLSTGITKKNSLIWKIGRTIEDFTYKNADKMIVISQDFKRNILAKGVPEKKIKVIYNWVEEDTVINIDRSRNVLFERYNLNPYKFYLTYCGNIGYTQNMNLLLEAAEELESINDIHFVLIGEGPYKNTVNSVIKQKNIKNVTLLPFQPYSEISSVFSLGDVGLVISKPGVGENSVPSKTWSIMSAERPVLANFDENELKQIIEENNCGIFTKAGNKQAFKDAIILLYKQRMLCSEMGKNGRNFILKNLTRAVGTNKYVEVLRSFDIKRKGSEPVLNEMRAVL